MSFVDIEYDIITHELHYLSDQGRRGFTYVLFTPRSPDLKSHPNQLTKLFVPPDIYLEVPSNMSRLTAKAWEVIGREPDPDRPSWEQKSRSRFRLSEEETQRRIELLVKFLNGGQEYQYVLGAPVVDPTLDPVEDFLINRKAGHCEYFASALALMLRAVNIPSRVVTGFKGGLSDSKDQSITVLQRNAHAWVEAYVNDSWEVFDPTPASSGAIEAGDQIPLWESVRRFISDTWNNYVVNMTYEDQNRVATPILGAIRTRSADGTVVTFIKWAGQVIITPRLWFSWQGLLVGCFILTFAFVIRFGYSLLKWFTRRLLVTLARSEAQRNSGVDFYEKFLVIMASHGLTPFPWQTQREFASVSLNQVSIPAERKSGLADLISRLFYQVRFGDSPLSEPVREKVDAELTGLEQDLKGSSDASPRTDPKTL